MGRVVMPAGFDSNKFPICLAHASVLIVIRPTNFGKVGRVLTLVLLLTHSLPITLLL